MKKKVRPSKKELDNIEIIISNFMAFTIEKELLYGGIWIEWWQKVGNKLRY